MSENVYTQKCLKKCYFLIYDNLMKFKTKCWFFLLFFWEKHFFLPLIFFSCIQSYLLFTVFHIVTFVASVYFHLNFSLFSSSATFIPCYFYFSLIIIQEFSPFLFLTLFSCTYTNRWWKVLILTKKLVWLISIIK